MNNLVPVRKVGSILDAPKCPTRRLVNFTSNAISSKCGKSDRTIANDTTLDNYVFFSLYTSIWVYIQGHIHEFRSNTTACFYSKLLKIAWISDLVNNLFWSREHFPSKAILWFVVTLFLVFKVTVIGCPVVWYKYNIWQMPPHKSYFIR